MEKQHIKTNLITAIERNDEARTVLDRQRSTLMAVLEWTEGEEDSD